MTCANGDDHELFGYVAAQVYEEMTGSELPRKDCDRLLDPDGEEWEKEGFDLILVGLGMTKEKAPWRYHSTTLWHFDTEAIEDQESYKRIAERMIEITQGSLTIDEIHDHVDLENKEAWLSFMFDGEQVKIDLTVEDDWVDSTIFGQFVKFLEQSDPTKIYVYYDLGGQDCIIGCLTRDDLERMKNHGVQFVPLT